MERPIAETKLPHASGGEMKKVADTAEPPIVVPVVVVAVHVHVALVVPAIEARELCKVPSVPLPLEYSRSCIVFGISNARALHTKYLHF